MSTLPEPSPALSQRLQALTETLAAARTEENVFEVVLTPALQALDAIAGTILLVDKTGRHLEIAGTQGYEPAAQTLWQDGPLDGHVPAGDALERRQPLFFEHQGELVRSYPELEARTGGVAAVATAVLPMFLDDGPLGAIILDFQEPHHFTPDETRFLQTLAAQCAIAVGRARLMTDLQRQVQERTARALDDARAQEAFVAFTEAVGTETNLLALAQQAIAVLRARFSDGSVGYYTPDGDLWKARAWSEDMDEALIARLRAGLPSSTHFIRGSLESGLPVFTDSWDPVREQIGDTEAYGAAAAYPLLVDGQVKHLLLCGLRGTRRWTERDRALVRAVGRSLALAFDRAEQTQAMEEERAALDALVSYQESVGGESDVVALARQAVEVVRLNLDEVSVAYYELEDGAWKARARSSDHAPEVVAQIVAGIPADAPEYAEATRSGTPIFKEGWDALMGGVSSAAAYETTAFIPLPVGGRTPGLFTAGTRRAHAWTAREQALLRAVTRGLRLTLERTEQTRRLETQNAELEARTLALERFAHLARRQETDAVALIRQAQQAVTELIGEGFAVYYELDGHAWHLRSQVGSPEDALIQASLESALPYETVQNFRIPWERGSPFYQDAYDPALDQGVPGTEALRSTAALPLWIGTRQQGLFGYGLKVSRPWSRADRAILETAVNSLGLSLERAEQTRQLEEERTALDAFAAFSEASAGTTDVQALARRAIDVLRAVLGEVSVAYSDVEGGRWKARVWSDDHTPEVVAVITAGIEVTAPSYAETLATRDAVFVSGWEAVREGVAATEGYGAGAFYPCLVDGAPQGLLAMGTQQAGDWSARERQVFRAVGRSLTLALERTEQARRLEAQNAELDARTRALEAFADLTRDLTPQGDPSALVERALEVVLSLLPEGFALYYVPEGERWQAKAQVGDMRHPQLQAAVDAGLPLATTTNLWEPWKTGQPVYQVSYDPNTDQLGDLVSGVGATATLPVLVEGEPVGVLAVVLFGVHGWSVTDRVLLETTARSLVLALEGARGVAQLARRTQELERSNAELEQFAYIASHDLQAPIRAVTSFAGIIHKRYRDSLDERGRLYLRHIVESGEHMKRLVDDLLAFSRVHTEQRPLLPTEAEVVFDAVARRLQGEVPGATLTRGELPVVQADAQQLDQLLQNLISNGLKYRREDVIPHVQVSAEWEGEFWRFAVSDNGIGIEPQYFERIFEIFQRLHGRDSYEGTGIGLAVCKKIVERHGGRLWLESTPDDGSTFFFTLPEA